MGLGLFGMTFGFETVGLAVSANAPEACKFAVIAFGDVLAETANPTEVAQSKRECL